MTLLEIIIVISLVVGLIAIVGGGLIRTADQADIDATKLQMGKVQQALDLYRIHHRRYPATEGGLASLVSDTGGSKKWRGPYIDEGSLKDRWDNDFRYESDGRNVKIFSDGPDMQEGTDDDIVYPESAAEQEAEG